MARYPRTSQPQSAVGIDWGNPITRGLESVLNFSLYDPVRKKFGALTNTTVSPSAKGNAFALNGTSSFVSWPEYTHQNTTALTVCGMVKTTTTNNKIFAGVYQTTTAQRVWQIGAANTAWVGAAGNELSIVLSSDGGSANTKAYYIPSISVCDGKWHHVAVTFLSGELSLYLDGVKYAPVKYIDTAFTAFYNGAAKPSLGAINAETGGASFSDGQNLGFQVWNRALSDAEIKSLSDNPWQVFAPVSRAIWTPTSSAVVSITRPTSDVSTSGWTGNPDNVTKFNNIDESTASDTDYITSPTISGGESITFGMSSLAAGTWDVRYRANFVGSSAQVRIHLLDGSNVSQGVSSWQTVTSTFTDYTASVTTTGAAVRVKIEVQ